MRLTARKMREIADRVFNPEPPNKFWLWIDTQLTIGILNENIRQRAARGLYTATNDPWHGGERYFYDEDKIQDYYTRRGFDVLLMDNYRVHVSWKEMEVDSNA